MLAFALKSTLILAVAALAAFGMRRRSAASRHLVWTAAAAALLTLPLLTRTLPALRVPVAATGPTAVFQVFVTSTPLNRASHVGQAPRPAADPQVRVARSVQWFPTIWFAGTVIAVFQMFWAYVVLMRVRRRARPFAVDEAAVLARTLGIEHPVAILETPRGTMPMTCGVFRPAVLMPAGASEWSRERLRIVLLHELAHIRRGDLATHLLARLALSLHWWNPLAWYAWRAFVKERERATDDLVLAAGERASDYAGHLLEIARSFQPEPATAAAALAMARRSELEGRLVAILDARVNRRPAGRRAAVIAALLAVTVAAPFAAIQAQDAAAPPNVNFLANTAAQQDADIDATIRAAATQKSHEILDRAAAAYINLSRFDAAQKLLESSLAIRAEKSGETSASYAAGLVKLGDLELKRNRSGEALAFYNKAVTLGDRAEVAPALLYLGLTAYGDGNYSAAEDYFQRTLNVDPNGPKAGPALTRLAGVRQHQPGREAEAELLYQKALTADTPNSYDLADTLAAYAMYLRHEGRADEAQQQDARGAQVRAAIGGKIESVVSSRGAYRVGNGVTAPQLLLKVEPQYTEEARAAKYQGTVQLYIEVQPDGRATNIRVQRSLGLGLDEKAVEAVQQWRFKPGTKEGQPVPVAATIEVNFRLM